ncbi:hypothetical protein [Nonomuraea ceibae]|uniref:hypothetical protein n=1 Tax=Nonomuraea ceibae TaxID=1935170 RepID=UPI001C5CCD96|nr:hypothetical protein [Nonomuraea ceibae]
MNRVIMAVLLALPLAVSGCGGGEREVTAEDVLRYRARIEHSSLDVSLITSWADYPAVETPEALAAQEGTVVGGVVDDWQQGPAAATYPGGPLDYLMLMRVRVTDPVKGATAGSYVFAGFDQGAVVRDATRAAADWLPAKGVADYRRAIPPGTKVVLFGDPRPPLGNIVKPGDPLPEGARIMSTPPQGVVLEDAELGVLVGGMDRLDHGGPAWLESATVTELVERLRSR